MLGVAPVGVSWRFGLLSIVWNYVEEYFSFNSLLGTLILLNSIGYLYIQDYNRLLQTELQRQRVQLNLLYDEQYQLLLERQVVTSQKRFDVSDDKGCSVVMHFPRRDEMVTVVHNRVI